MNDNLTTFPAFMAAVLARLERIRAAFAGLPRDGDGSKIGGGEQ